MGQQGAADFLQQRCSPMEQIGVLSDDWYAQFADALEAV